MNGTERGWKAAYEAEKALTDRLVQEHAAVRHGLLVRISDLRSALRAVLDAWSGDMHPDLAAVADSAIVRSGPDHVADDARAEVQDLIRRAAEVPGLSAELEDATTAFNIQTERIDAARAVLRQENPTIEEVRAALYGDAP